MSGIPQILDMMEFNRRGLWSDARLSYDDSIETSLASLNAYGERYSHWIINYSGGKDSSATLSFVVWAIKSGQIKAPEKLVIAYADTGMEMPPLVITADKVLSQARANGYDARHILPDMKDRFWVYMLGRGVPPPTRGMRWCTEHVKANPIRGLRKQLQREYFVDQLDSANESDLATLVYMISCIDENEPYLRKGMPAPFRAEVNVWIKRANAAYMNVTGVRKGESAIRDQRISMSCSKNDGECGQGWFHKDGGENSLAPLVHWRLCHVWKWIYDARNPYPITRDIHLVYLADDIYEMRTGCMECRIVDVDMAFKFLTRKPEWAHLKPFHRLRWLYDELAKPHNRKRKAELTVNANGKLRVGDTGSLGALRIEARQWGFEQVRQMESEAGYRLISDEEEAVIRQMWADRVYPRGWSDANPNGDEEYDKMIVLPDQSVVIQEHFA